MASGAESADHGSEKTRAQKTYEEAKRAMIVQSIPPEKRTARRASPSLAGEGMLQTRRRTLSSNA